MCFVLTFLWILVFTLSLVSDVSPFSKKVLYVNTMCAHGCVVVDGDSVFVCATRGRARDLLRSGHSGPKTIADLMAAIVPRPCAVCTTLSPSGPNALLVFTSFTGVPPAPHGAFRLGRPRPHGQGQLSQHRITEVSTSLEPRSHDSWMSEVSHRLMTASRTSVIHGSFPGRDAGPHGPAPLSPRELLK